MRQVINVRSLGAVGDGITDDTQVIRAATALADGGTLYFPAGVYAIREPIKLSHGMYIQGEGIEHTTITPLPIFEGEGLIEGIAAAHYDRHTRISNLKLVGQQKFPCGIVLTRMANVGLDDLFITECDIGVKLEESIVIEIARCKIHNSKTAGVHASQATNGLTINEGRIQNTTHGPGVLIDGPASFAFSMHAVAVESNGLQTYAPGVLIGPTSGVRGGAITGCHFESNNTGPDGQLHFGTAVADGRSSGFFVGGNWFTGDALTDYAVGMSKAEGLTFVSNTSAAHNQGTYFLGELRKCVLLGGHSNEALRDGGTGKWAVAFDGYENTFSMPEGIEFDFRNSTKALFRNSLGNLAVTAKLGGNIWFGHNNEIHLKDGKLGFLGAEATARTAIGGDTQGNVALQNLLAELARKGLITNNTI